MELSASGPHTAAQRGSPGGGGVTSLEQSTRRSRSRQSVKRSTPVAGRWTRAHGTHGTLNPRLNETRSQTIHTHARSVARTDSHTTSNSNMRRDVDVRRGIDHGAAPHARGYAVVRRARPSASPRRAAHTTHRPETLAAPIGLHIGLLDVRTVARAAAQAWSDSAEPTRDQASAFSAVARTVAAQHMTTMAV